METGPAPDDQQALESLRALAEARDARCPRCGYSLRGLVSPRCPECGSTLTPGAVLEHMGRPSRADLIASRQGYIACFVLYLLSLMISAHPIVRSPSEILLLSLPPFALIILGGLRRALPARSHTLRLTAVVCWVLVLLVLTRAVIRA